MLDDALPERYPDDDQSLYKDCQRRHCPIGSARHEDSLTAAKHKEPEALSGNAQIAALPPLSPEAQ